MKIKLDENLPSSLVPKLEQLGHDADTVYTEGLSGCTDDLLWEKCQKNKRFLITQDLDFSDMRKFVPGTHFGILIVRFKNPGSSEIKRRLLSLFENEDASKWEGCFVVVTDRKIRIHRPR
jgi:predicted nuclease of predicted toxin-antitoxin system